MFSESIRAMIYAAPPLAKRGEFIYGNGWSNDGNLIINHEYPNPKKIVERLNDTHCKYIIASIVKHCMAESVNFDERLNKLLKQI